jgi:hypothetical protein
MPARPGKREYRSWRQVQRVENPEEIHLCRVPDTTFSNRPRATETCSKPACLLRHFIVQRRIFLARARRIRSFGFQPNDRFFSHVRRKSVRAHGGAGGILPRVRLRRCIKVWLYGRTGRGTLVSAELVTRGSHISGRGKIRGVRRYAYRQTAATSARLSTK